MRVPAGGHRGHIQDDPRGGGRWGSSWTERAQPGPSSRLTIDLTEVDDISGAKSKAWREVEATKALAAQGGLDGQHAPRGHARPEEEGIWGRVESCALPSSRGGTFGTRRRAVERLRGRGRGGHPGGGRHPCFRRNFVSSVRGGDGAARGPIDNNGLRCHARRGRHVPPPGAGWGRPRPLPTWGRTRRFRKGCGRRLCGRAPNKPRKAAEEE